VHITLCYIKAWASNSTSCIHLHYYQP